MPLPLLFIALLLGIVYWRHVVAALIAGTVILGVLGLLYLAQLAGANDHAHRAPTVGPSTIATRVTIL